MYVNAVFHLFINKHTADIHRFPMSDGNHRLTLTQIDLQIWSARLLREPCRGLWRILLPPVPPCFWRNGALGVSSELHLYVLP